MPSAKSASTQTTVNNQTIATRLDEMASMLQIIGANRFKYLALQNGAETVRNLGQDISAIAAEGSLTDIQGIGKGIAANIQEILETGTFAEYEKLSEQVPAGVLEMLQIPDVGPKSVKRFWEELDITSVAELKSTAEAGKLAALKGFGKKSEEKILKGIDLMAQRGDGRTPIGKARPLALELIDSLQAALPDGTIARIEAAGSLRRWRETIGDLDFLVVSQEPITVMEAFRTLPHAEEIVNAGDTKSTIIVPGGLQVDLRVVEAKHWGAALQYFTGSQAHNVAVREHAQKLGWSLNEYGLTATGKGNDPEGAERFFDTEEALYEFLGLAWVPPQMRENRGEVQAARSNELPTLVQISDLRGELHGHTTFSDGRNTLAEMAEAARACGYQYWAVCDHSVGLGITAGVDEAKLQQQAIEIAAINKEYAEQGIDFRLLCGTEAEVLADGTLGLPDAVLAELDVVVASIHSALRQERAVITARCLKIVRNLHVDILGHPTGRLIGRRPPSDLDVEQVLQACVETGTVVEINAHPSRLDLNDIYARRAVELGCKIAINTDAHGTDYFDYMPYGIATAQRAWLQAADVINTLPVDEMLSTLKDAGGK